MKAYETSVTYNVKELIDAMVDVSEYRIANSPKDYKQSLGMAKFLHEVGMTSFSLGRQSGQTQGVVDWCKRMATPQEPCLIITHNQRMAETVKNRVVYGDHPLIKVLSIHSRIFSQIDTYNHRWRVFVDGPVAIDINQPLQNNVSFSTLLEYMGRANAIKSLVKVGC